MVLSKRDTLTTAIQVGCADNGQYNYYDSIGDTSPMCCWTGTANGFVLSKDEYQTVLTRSRIPKGYSPAPDEEVLDYLDRADSHYSLGFVYKI